MFWVGCWILFEEPRVPINVFVHFVYGFVWKLIMLCSFMCSMSFPVSGSL